MIFFLKILNYSYLSALIGSSFAAFNAGNIETIEVTTIEHIEIIIIDLTFISEGILLKKYISSGNKGILKISLRKVLIFSLYIENLRQFLSSTFNISLFPEEIYFLSKMPSEINPTSIFIISICSILITIIVSIFPAFKAAKLDPIKALKYE